MKYRKKPVVVEAIRYTGNNCPEIEAFMGVQGWCAGDHDPIEYSINTPEGRVDACPGDWIIRDAQGEYYPCKPDIFEATYEAVMESDAGGVSDYQDLTDYPICPQLAAERDDALREAEGLRAELDGKSAALQVLASERRSCTPAERALIYAAVAWRRALRDYCDRQPTARYVTWAELHDPLCAAVDAVLAERGEA